MRKRITAAVAKSQKREQPKWMDVDQLATVEITSEDPAHPIEGALLPGTGSGWRAAQPGIQILRLIFNSPQNIKLIHLVFTEEQQSRTQEFALRCSAGVGRPFNEIVRQRYNFTPGSKEIEDYAVNFSGVGILELEIVPAIDSKDVYASLKELRLVRVQTINRERPAPMPLGTKNRQIQTADQCKQHLRQKHMDKLVLVEEFIHEFEGSGKERDIMKWGQFTDASHNQVEMVKGWTGILKSG